MAEYRIDDLAREAGTTVRNVRVYQDRGLLPPPRREGRAGIYTDVHLGRLRLSGLLAWWFWLWVHILFLIGFRNRIIVLINWAWAYWSYQRHARIILGGDAPRE